MFPQNFSLDILFSGRGKLELPISFLQPPDIICSCVPHFVFLHCLFLAVVTGTCFHSSYMCFFHIIAFVVKNINCSQTSNNLLQIRTREVFSLTLSVKHWCSQDVETFFCVCSAFMHILWVVVGLCLGKFWEIVANVKYIPPSVECFAPVCYLHNSLRVGTETAVLISHRINSAVLVN